MQLGMIGLGRMGGNMSRRLRAAGHDVVGYDVDPETTRGLAEQGVVTPSTTIVELIEKLTAPRVVWMMIPAGHVGSTMREVTALAEADDLVVDGGNSHYRDAVDRAEALRPSGIHHVDVGVSGGIWGLESGFCLMVGGDPAAVARLEPILSALAPGVDAAVRTPGRKGDPGPAEQGWLHCGPPGAGHFVKMVHNGIEYGVMAAYAEGFAILHRADVGSEHRPPDAETAPLRDPQYYRYSFDLAEVAEVWRRGSVIRSWLLDLTARALWDDPGLDRFTGRVSDSGEGRWTVQAAIDEGVPAGVIAAALHQRFSSRDLGDHGDRLLSAMRERFGGHLER